MSEKFLVPDIGDFENVEVIEVLVKPGDQIKKNDPLVTIESDKSSVEIPSTIDGKVESIEVKVGDKVSKGDLLLSIAPFHRRGRNALIGVSARSFDSIDKIEKGTAEFKEQDHDKATYAKKILKSEAKINWNESAQKILAKINGLNPNPGAWFFYKKERYKVWRAQAIGVRNDIGKIIDDKLTVGCKDQSIRILEIQKDSNRNPARDQTQNQKIGTSRNISLWLTLKKEGCL